MTNREFFEAIANGKMNEEVKAFAQESIAKIDARNEKRKNTPSKTSVENEPLKEKIMAFIIERNEVCIASAIAEAVEMTTAKVSALCRQLVSDGKLEETEVKVPKQGKRKGYSIVQGN